MDTLRRYGSIFRLDGTNQLQRMPVPLDNTYIQPDERTLSDLVNYGKQLAAEIRYYNLTGQSVGDWQAFFSLLENSSTNEILSSAEIQQLLDSKKDCPAHVALYIVFIKLYQILQKDLNQLPIRHLRHFYENVLGLERRAATTDEVHVIFELAKNSSPTLVEAGTELDGGKDAQGNPLIYKTASDIVVGHSAIKEKYRLVKEQDKRGNSRFFIAEEITEQEGQSWYTFGKTQLDMDDSQRFMREAQLGFALSSPVLQMAEGVREIHIDLYLRSADNQFPTGHHLGFALVVELTGEEGWLPPDQLQAEIINNGVDQPRLSITLFVEEAAAAIVAPTSDVHPGSPVSQWPVARFLLTGDSGHYDVLNGLQVERSEITVDVKGAKKLLLQNEQGQLNPEKPLPLFGNQPHVGSSFYIGSDEIFSKRLTSFSIEAEWQEKPSDLLEHYREYFDFVNYTLENEFTGKFAVDIEMLYERTWVPLLNDWRLFDFAKPDQRIFPVSLVDQSFVDYLFGENNYRAHPELKGTSMFDASNKFGFVRLVLNGPSYGSPYASEIPLEAFGHKAYAPRYAKKAIEASRDPDAEIALPNSPYTPTLASLSVDYTAISTLLVGDNQASDSFFTIDAFGSYEADIDHPARLVPDIEGQATLYIGVENNPVPSIVSFLFQLDKGTATGPGEPLAVGETRWSYLAEKKWERIPGASVFTDSTYGYQKSGIVSLAVSSKASLDHHLMPGGLLWLKATIDKPADSACRAVDIHDRAVLAQLDVAEDDLPLYEEHLQGVLPANTISKLKKRNSAIKKVSQPYDSFGGRTREQDLHYFQSSSERLRHRNRAVTLWDMERLILNEFSEVFKVKCLPHSDAEGNRKAGELALVIVPDLRAVETINPLEPRADTVLMRKIEDFVVNLVSPFSSVHVIHPVYERIRVDAQIAFVSGLDAGYYANLLNEELQRFLSPWAYEEGQDIVFGTRIYRSEILAFLEGRDYIDYVVNFTLYHSYTGPRRGGVGDMAVDFDFIVYPEPVPAIGGMEIENTFVVGRGVDTAAATLPHAILVSHSEHRITPLDGSEDLCKGVSQLGIGYMTVELDFNVASQ